MTPPACLSYRCPLNLLNELIYSYRPGDLNDGQVIVGIRVVNPLNGGRTGSEVHDSG
jgi:hypothetical protein